MVGGYEHGIFENQFRVVVRGEHGAVIARTTVTGAGHWRARPRYQVASKQPGTIEAVAWSPKDGSLLCIAEQGVELPIN